MRERWQRIAPWIVGVTLGVVLLGPMLRTGSLLNLDLVLIDPIPVPAGAWGLGPELPRRVPFMIPVAWTGALVGSWVATRGLLVGIIAVATAGMHRAAVGLPGPVRYGLALLYGAGPFMVTRLGIGHLAIALAAALVPWTLPTLLRPTRSPARTALAAGALGLTGIVGGAYAALAVVAGLIADRPSPRVAFRALVPATVTQLPWVVPGVVVFAQGVDPSDSSLFAARIPSPIDVVRLAAGQGFWQDRFQVGFDRLDALLVGAALVALAVVGARRLPEPWRGRGAVLAGVVLAVVVIGAAPGLDDVVADAVGNPVLAPFREAHRLLPLALVWILLAAGHGVVRLVHRSGVAWEPPLLAVPLVLGLVVAGPGFWGLGHGFAPIHLDDDWTEVRALVESEPGALVALPWAQYLNVAEFDERRVHHPAPLALAADVIVSSDPRLGGPAQERADEREPLVDELVERVRSGDAVAEELGELGVRWVLMLHSIDWQDYRGLRGDPGLEPRVTGDVLDLYEVGEWRGPVETATGSTAIDWSFRAAGRVDAPEGGVWHTTGATGWLRGLSTVDPIGGGRLRLPSGGGVMWYWPALLVVVVDLVAAAVVIGAAWMLRRSPARAPVALD